MLGIRPWGCARKARISPSVRSTASDGKGGAGILISAETAALLGDRFDLEKHALDIGGEPVTAYAVGGNKTGGSEWKP